MFSQALLHRANSAAFSIMRSAKPHKETVPCADIRTRSESTNVAFQPCYLNMLFTETEWKKGDSPTQNRELIILQEIMLQSFLFSVLDKPDR